MYMPADGRRQQGSGSACSRRWVHTGVGTGISNRGMFRLCAGAGYMGLQASEQG